MPLPRRAQVDVSTTRFYHVVSRCVRRAFLCGEDRFSGRSYEHRRQWVVERLELLAEVFAIDICAYAVMTNHTHLTLRLSPERARRWSDREVVERWSRIYGVPEVIQEARKRDASPAIREAAKDAITVRRERLTDLSWFMKTLNEYIAREANAEDDCTGAFWEGRFKSQALLDERALYACMTYVDLNPIRAAMARTPEESDYTSIQERIRRPQRLAVPLVPFGDEEGAAGASEPLPMNREDYLQLVDWTGRAMSRAGRGAIDAEAPPILERLALDAVRWRRTLDLFDKPELRALGSPSAIRAFAEKLARRWFRGLGACRSAFGST